MRSLRARLSSSLMLVLSGLMLVLLLLTWMGLTSLTRTFVATRLGHDLEGLISEIDFDEQITLQLPADAMGHIYQQPYSGHYFTVISGSQVLRSRSLWDAELPLPDTSPLPPQLLLPGPLDQELLVLTRRVTLQNQPVVVVITEDLSTLNAGLRRLMLAALVLYGFTLGLVLLLQQRIVSSSLRPLEAARQQVAALSTGEIQQLDTDTPAEIRPLVLELNRLLQLTVTRLRRSRHALGDLAHALKTPLTVIMQLGDELDEKQATQLQEQAGTIHRLMERELRRARIAGAPAPGQQVLLITEVDDLLDTLGRIHRQRNLTFLQRIPPGSRFPGDRDDLLELLGNLLDNACQYAHRQVRVSVVAREPLTLVVEDDGPGCPAGVRVSLTRRGVRADEQGEGHGLGLSIVNEIVQQYGGELTLDASPEMGGLRVTVRLPAVPTQ